MLNESKGNMYPFVTHTWNPIKGECPHSCTYCYMLKWGTKMKPLRLVESELKTTFPDDAFIFVGSSTDMWLAPDELIEPVMDKCLRNIPTRYLFQTKNPESFQDWLRVFRSLDCVLACTIETNRHIGKISSAPPVEVRQRVMTHLDFPHKMISIEPVMDFDVESFLRWINLIKPDFVSIGANTNYKVKLPEPSPEKLREFLDKLSGITQVVQKNNLGRLLK